MLVVGVCCEGSRDKDGVGVTVIVVLAISVLNSRFQSLDFEQKQLKFVLKTSRDHALI